MKDFSCPITGNFTSTWLGWVMWESGLLNNFKKQQDKLIKSHKLKINLVGISNSRKMVIDPNGIDPGLWKERLEQGEPANLDLYVAQMREKNLRNSVFHRLYRQRNGSQAATEMCLIPMSRW